VVSSAATTDRATWLRSDLELLLFRRNNDIGVLIGPDVIWVKIPSWCTSVLLLLVSVSFLKVVAVVETSLPLAVQWQDDK
jgi:hypothetical protein